MDDVMAGEDFVQAQLSPAGVKMAGKGGVVRVVKAQSEFEFKTGVPQRVTRAWEWAQLLQPMQYEGLPIFEIVAGAAMAASPAPAAAAQPAPVPHVPVAPNHPAKIWPPAPEAPAAEEKN